MCGIFGIIVGQDSNIIFPTVKKITDKLFILSESRGKEASGLAVKTSTALIVYKRPEIATELVRSKTYNRIFKDLITLPFALIGHSRLVTSGFQELNVNNQPVIKGAVVGIHNGIIVNDHALWKAFSELEKEYEVDTEIMLSLFQLYFENTNSFSSAIRKTFSLIQGTASVALITNQFDQVVLATNTGSLYTCFDRNNCTMVFASERYILNKFVVDLSLNNLFDVNSIVQLKPGVGYIIDINECSGTQFSLNDNVTPMDKNVKKGMLVKVDDLSKNDNRLQIKPRIFSGNKLKKELKEIMHRTWVQLYNEINLKRCTKCILPETMTFIDFDEDGVCNYCKHYEKVDIVGVKTLEEGLKKYRSGSGKQDCVVALSGGRDSCYGLHYIKKELGMNPIAFTYDWGVVTDLARRNQARLCGELGVEHIIVSANITKKRRNIRANIEAWLKRPELGAIPLLMAGDKQMLYYARQIMKQTNIDLLIYCIGNGLEHSPFKIGFSGVLLENFTPHGWIGWNDKIRYFSYFLKQYLLNPSYINISVIDTLWAFFCTFIMKEQDSVHLFKYIPWNEENVNLTLINEYDWETSPDTITTWRIGDGTASFYNYIYMSVAGLSEHDTFRSNQIREGSLSRKDALTLIPEDNKPRYESIEWYANTIGFDCNNAIQIIENISKIYQ